VDRLDWLRIGARLGRSWFYWAGICCAICTAGCIEFLEIRADPSDSTITFTDPSGHAKTLSGSSPLQATIDFGQSDHYDIKVDPPADQNDQLKPANIKLAQADYDQLPGTDGSHKTLSVTLTEITYEELHTPTPFLDPTLGWIGEMRADRAFRDPAERVVAAPTKIFDFPKDVCVSGASISPDGTHIVFSATKFDLSQVPDIQGAALGQSVPISGAQIWAVPIGSQSTQFITQEAFQDIFPSYSPDGKFILFSSDRLRSACDDILEISSEGNSGTKIIYRDVDRARSVKPTQAAADGTISFAVYPQGWRKLDDVQIYTVKGQNGFPTLVTRGTQPAISPDGKHIAYIGTDGNLWVINSDGTTPIQLTTDADAIVQSFKSSLSGPDQAAELQQFNYYEGLGHDRLLMQYTPYSFPSWSPGGKRILYSSKEGLDPTGRPHDDIYIRSLDTGVETRLTTNPSQNRFPVMSPDQTFIYFQSNRGLSWSLYRIPAPSPPDPLN